MADRQHTYGQFDTPVAVADLLLGFSLRAPTDRLLDPSCGPGALLQRAARWQAWLSTAPASRPADTLWGAELDVALAEQARHSLPGAHILNRNFLALRPDRDRLFDAIIGNPPYTRAAWIERLQRDAGQQLSIFEAAPETDQESATGKMRLVPRHLWQALSGRAGLHAYFLLHAADFLREGGRLAFVVPNGWLDIAYGQALKEFLRDHFRIIALVESAVERWFREARINTCLVILEKCAGPQRRLTNQVRLVQLRRPLADLLPQSAADYRRVQSVERLITKMLPGRDQETSDLAIRVVSQANLTPAERWGVALRAPAVYRRRRQQPGARLASWARLRRGHTSGANSFFYLKPDTVARWGIEAHFRQPLLKSLRGVSQLRLDRATAALEVLIVPPDTILEGSGLAAYVAWGEAQGFHQRPTCAARNPWYSLGQQIPAHLVLPKGIWRRHLAPLLAEPLPLDQQLYGVHLASDVPPAVAAALLNSAWFGLQCELQGRVNFGEGLLWLAAYELSQAALPDPRHLAPEQASRLAAAFEKLAGRPLGETGQELLQPDRRALDEAVFDVLGFSAGESEAVWAGLLERIAWRTGLAQSGRQGTRAPS